MAAEMYSTCGGPADSAKVGSGIPPLGSGRILRLGATAKSGFVATFAFVHAAEWVGLHRKLTCTGCRPAQGIGGGPTVP